MNAAPRNAELIVSCCTLHVACRSVIRVRSARRCRAGQGWRGCSVSVGYPASRPCGPKRAQSARSAGRPALRSGLRHGPGGVPPRAALPARLSVVTGRHPAPPASHGDGRGCTGSVTPDPVTSPTAAHGRQALSPLQSRNGRRASLRCGSRRSGEVSQSPAVMSRLCGAGRLSLTAAVGRAGPGEGC